VTKQGKVAEVVGYRYFAQTVWECVLTAAWRSFFGKKIADSSFLV